MTPIYSAALSGLQCTLVEVETDIAPGLPRLTIVGLPDMAVQESRERIRAAIKNSGLLFPRTRVTVNLAPADIKKEGPSYDVPIAASILYTAGLIQDTAGILAKTILMGELALDGTLRSVSGVLSMVLKARELGFCRIFLPPQNAAEAALVDGIEVLACPNLLTLVEFLNGNLTIIPFEPPPTSESITFGEQIDFSHIRGQTMIKRALEIAATGSHNLLMNGPPGAGKTILARAVPSILPPLSKKEALEVTALWSVGGFLASSGGLIWQRPFRHPHHSASAASLIGGGANPRPGEISLAHRGVLFLDEFPEFSRQVLEQLRQPLEDGTVTIARAAGTVEYPAKFMLVAAQNPCPCGYSTDPYHPCICSPGQVLHYQKKISGPIMDRLDIVIEIQPVPVEELAGEKAEESSETVRQRVEDGRARQRLRFQNTTLQANAEMKSADLRRFCLPSDAALSLLKAATAKFHLSARAYYRLLKLARSIADLAASETMEATHLAEAIQYRTKFNE